MNQRWGEGVELLESVGVTPRQVFANMMMALDSAKGTKAEKQAAQKAWTILNDALLRWHDEDREEGE